MFVQKNGFFKIISKNNSLIVKILFLQFVILFFVFNLVSEAASSELSVESLPETQQLQSQLLNEFGIRISNSKVSSEALSEDEYRIFLHDLLSNSRSRNLGPRYYPSHIKFIARNQNTNSSGYRSADLKYGEDTTNNFSVGNHSAEAFVLELKNNFPELNSEESRKLKYRNQAINMGINDILAWLKSREITVASCDFALDSCRVKSSEDIAYFHKEKFLQGLVRLKDKIEKGKAEDTDLFAINPFTTDVILGNALGGIFNSILDLESGSVFYNLPGSSEEEMTQALIEKNIAVLDGANNGMSFHTANTGEIFSVEEPYKNTLTTKDIQAILNHTGLSKGISTGTTTGAPASSSSGAAN